MARVSLAAQDIACGFVFSFIIHANGWLAKVDFLLVLILDWLHLPASAALPLVMDICTGTAGTVAAMSTIPFTHEQMTLVAFFSMISHNMIPEGFVQTKSGFSFMGSVIIWLTASVVTVWVVSRLFFSIGPDTAVVVTETIQSLMKFQVEFHRP